MSIVPRRPAVNALWGTQALWVCRLEDVTIHNVALEEKLKELTQNSLNEEDRAAQMDRFLNDEEVAMKVGNPTKTTDKDGGFFICISYDAFSLIFFSQRLDDQLQDHQEDLFCHKEQLNTLRTEEKDYTARFSSNKTEITRLEKQTRNLESELSAQRSTIEGQVHHKERSQCHQSQMIPCLSFL